MPNNGGRGFAIACYARCSSRKSVGQSRFRDKASLGFTLRKVALQAETARNPARCVGTCPAGEGHEEDILHPEICADEALGWRAVWGHVKLVNIDRGHSTMLRERFVDSMVARFCAT